MNLNYARLDSYLAMLRKDIYPEEERDLDNELTEKSIEMFVKPVVSEVYKVLDVGCGQGLALKRFQNFGLDVVGITLGVDDLEACSKKGFLVEIMDQSFLDFEKDTFDLVWARHCLEHSIMPLVSLFEFNRILKEGKYLYLEVPQAESIHVNNPNHYSLFGPKGWKHLLSMASFEIIQDGKFNFTLIDGTPDEYLVFWCRKIGNILT